MSRAENKISIKEGMIPQATIYAPAGGGAGSALSIIRISGPQTGDVLRAILGKDMPPPRYARYAAFHDPRSSTRDLPGYAPRPLRWPPATCSQTKTKHCQ